MIFLYPFLTRLTSKCCCGDECKCKKGCKCTSGKCAKKSDKSLFERLGGEGAINAAVDMFYDRVLADKVISAYFKNTNMTHQRQQQKDFLTQAFGGPSNYKGQDMYTAHKNLGITNKAFDDTGAILIGVLKDLKVGQQEINDVQAAWDSLRDETVIKKATLLERIGGVKSLHVAVDMFYDTVLADERVNHFFKNTDMVHQRKQQQDFLQTVLGDPETDNVYKGADMLTAHKHLKITDSAFNAIAENLSKTLVKCGVDKATLGEILVVVETTRADIVNTKEEQTIFQIIGGRPALEKAIDLFYDRVLVDDRVNNYFKNTNMVHQRSQQKDFLEMVLGGENKYKGLDMYEAHKNLRIDHKAMDTIIELLAGALIDCGVPKDVVGQIGAIAETLRKDIVTVSHKSDLLSSKIGKERIHAAIDILFDRLIADECTRHLFEGQNIHELKDIKREQVYHLFSGDGLIHAGGKIHVEEGLKGEIDNMFLTVLNELQIDSCHIEEAISEWKAHNLYQI